MLAGGGVKRTATSRERRGQPPPKGIRCCACLRVCRNKTTLRNAQKRIKLGLGSGVAQNIAASPHDNRTVGEDSQDEEEGVKGRVIKLERAEKERKKKGDGKGEGNGGGEHCKGSETG